MLRTMLVVTLLTAPVLVGQEPVRAELPTPQLLWPDGAPGARGTEERDRPSIFVHRATPRDDATATPAVVVCPGGGYGHLAIGHEGHDVARWLNDLGVTAVVLDYRHHGKGYRHPAPLQDAQRALRTTRANAAAWRIDPARIGVLGFSAGGHLASSVCVHHDDGDADAEDVVERQSCRPDFAVLCYPVIALGQPFTHRGSQRNLLGEEPDAPLVLQMSSERQVDARTPPTFLWHTSADRGVSAQNSVAYYLALLEHSVPCELHVFERGEHGIDLARGHDAEPWTELCRRWLVTRGVLPK